MRFVEKFEPSGKIQWTALPHKSNMNLLNVAPDNMHDHFVKALWAQTTDLSSIDMSFFAWSSLPCLLSGEFILLI